MKSNIRDLTDVTLFYELSLCSQSIYCFSSIIYLVRFNKLLIIDYLNNNNNKNISLKFSYETELYWRNKKKLSNKPPSAVWQMSVQQIHYPQSTLHSCQNSPMQQIWIQQTETECDAIKQNTKPGIRFGSVQWAKTYDGNPQ